MLLTSLLLATAQPAVAPPPADRGAERALFKQIVELQTVAGKPAEFRKLTALLTAEFRKAGMTTIVKDHDNTQTLIARWKAPRSSDKKPILLLAHMDVVDAKAADWKNPPFQFREEGGFYLGRGSSDNKAALTGLVLALHKLKASGWTPSRDLVVLFTGDEETGMKSVKRASTEWRDLIDAEYALNFDAGGGSRYRDGRIDAYYMQIAEKTYADFKLTAVNEGGHSSAPHPDNAIYALAGALKNLEEYRFEPMSNPATRAFFERIAAADKGSFGELVTKWLSNPTDRRTADLLEANEPGYTRTRCVATQLSGGHAPNALPQRAEANVNCRIFPGVSFDQVKADLQRIAGKDVAVTLDTENSTPATDVSPLRDDLVAAYQAAVRTRFADATIIPMQSAGATDGSYLRAVGIPVYGVGGLWSYLTEPSNAHGLNEKVVVDGFHDQVPIIADLLRRTAG